MNKNMHDLISELADSLSAEDLLFAHYSSEIAAAIAARRVEMGLTQKEFAEKLGKTQAVISKWENGEVNFTLKSLIEIAQKLDLVLNLSFKQAVASPSNIIQFPVAYRSLSSPISQYTTDSDLKEM